MADPIAEEKKIVDGDSTAGKNGAGEGSSNPEFDVDKGRSVPLATFLESEKKLKTKVNQLEVERDKRIAEDKVKEDAKLIEDGELQKLIDSKTTELSGKDSEIVSLKLKADEMTEFKASKIDEAKAELGSDWDDEYASLTITAIDNLVKKMSPKISINTDKGVSGEITKMQLTDAEKKEAYMRYSNLSKERAEELYKHNLIKQKERDKK